MLVLTRRPDEAIMIGDHIEIVVVSVDGDRVRLGIKAPPGMNIYRGEIYQAIQKENQAAARTPGSLSELVKAVQRKNAEPPDPPASPSKPAPPGPGG